MLMRRDNLLEWVKPVRQARSLETLERLLDAAETLILEQGVEAASVSAVVKRAGSSVGAFYARFADKDSLLGAVCERFLEQSRATVDAALEPERWVEESLENLLGIGLQFMLRTARERRALLACVVGRAGRDLALSNALEALAAHFGEKLQCLLLSRGEASPGLRVARVTRMVAGLLLCFVQAGSMRHPAQPAALDEAVVAEELALLCRLYLAHSPDGRTPPSSTPDA